MVNKQGLNLLLVDKNNLMYRMLGIHQAMRFGKKRTGGLYGFIQLFSKYVNVHLPSAIVVCDDYPPYEKLKIFPSYKGDRKDNPSKDYYDYIVESAAYVEHFLSAINVPILKIKGCEADDLIADIIISGPFRFDRYIICSHDDDMYQLLSKDVIIQRSKDIYTVDNFIDEYKIQPREWIDVLYLKGSHNGVPPLQHGMGPATALKTLEACKQKGISIYNPNSGVLYKKERIAAVMLPYVFDMAAFEPIKNKELYKLKSFEIRDVINLLTKEYGIQVMGFIEQALENILSGVRK